MDSAIVLIADGPENISIPCRIFPDFDTAKKRCDEIFGKEGEKLLDKETGDLRGYRYSADLESEKDPWPISKQLFTRFYYGCGGPYVFVLVMVKFDTKFVGFDLD